jgi:hypothetical protein
MRKYATYSRLPEGAATSDEEYFNVETAGTTLDRWRVWKGGFGAPMNDGTVSEEVSDVR